MKTEECDKLKLKFNRNNHPRKHVTMSHKTIPTSLNKEFKSCSENEVRRMDEKGQQYNLLTFKSYFGLQGPSVLHVF